jgi:RNA polymerase sigma-70 factor (ECF subfamily)
MKGRHMERPPETSSAGPEAFDKTPSRASFDALYDRYKDMVFKFAFHLTQDRREAEDLYQETWLRVVRHFSEIQTTPEKLKPWLYTIVSNLFKDDLRRKRARPLFHPQRTDSQVEAWDPVSQEVSLEPGPEKAAENAHTARLIQKAVSRLPHKQRQVFLLKEVEGLRQEEISQILGIPKGTVKSLGHRAAQRLQRELTAYNLGKRKDPCVVRTLSVY